MNPTDLLNPRCKLTGTKPVTRSTKHLFLDLPKLSDKLQSYIDTTSQLGGWSANCVQVTQGSNVPR
jgi:methionyl-tRNA synthetase